MSTKTFSGPVKAGTIRATTGTTVGTNMSNVGFAVMAQSDSLTQSTTSAASGIIIPANSQIVEIYIYVSTAWDGSSPELNVGTSATSTELVTAIDVSVVNRIKAGSDATPVVSLWKDIGSSDLRIWTDSTATSSDAGRGVITVTYIQDNDLG